ncbi:MAG: alpha/beta hydrolase fold [Caulobacter sp.]|nr:alpha/beta hydrolase fold [Caulobacter sp.]
MLIMSISKYRTVSLLFLRQIHPKGTPSMPDLYWTAPDGLRLHAVDYPGSETATPVICIHGLTRNARDFDIVAPQVARLGRRVIAVDIRGRGGSARDPDFHNYQPGVYAADIAALLDATGIKRAVFIGTSMGGIITMVLAAIRPEAIAGSVLNDIGPEVSPVGIARIAGYVGQGRPPQDWAGAAEYIKQINQAAFPEMDDAGWAAFARRTFTEGPDGKPVLDYDPDISAAFRPDPDAPPVAPPDMWPLFRALNAAGPVALVRGGISDLIDEAIAQRMREAAPHMIYAEVPGVGHAPLLTEPEAWGAITQMLARVP